MDGLIGSGGLLKCPALTQRRPLVTQAADLDPGDSERPTAFESDWVHYWVQRLLFDRYLVDLTH
jgi:hypothetical protein